MTKEEYLTRLQYNIASLPPLEVQNIMQYYREYFDDAGEENLDSIMQELGTPEQLAQKILSGFSVPYCKPKASKSSSNAVLIAVIVVLTCPVWFVAGIVAASLIFALFVIVFSLIFSVGIVGIALAGSGLFVFVMGFPTLFTHVPTGILLIGAGLILCALGMLILLLLIWLFAGTIQLCSYLIKCFKEYRAKRKSRKAAAENGGAL